jgi:hypothetical protein
VAANKADRVVPRSSMSARTSLPLRVFSFFLGLLRVNGFLYPHPPQPAPKVCLVSMSHSGSPVTAASNDLADRFWTIDMSTKRRMEKMLRYFEEERVDALAFNGINGYGHGDVGREKLDNIIGSHTCSK